MRPSPAEVARTLLRGRLPGVLRIAGSAAPIPVRHATDDAGRPLVLARPGDALDLAARADAPVVLSIDDVPPFRGAPSAGRAEVSGRLRRLDPAEAATAVHEFAEANPIEALLDLGRGVSMQVIDIDRVRLEHRLGATDIHVTAYAAAEPDPLRELERDLLADLAEHHLPQIESYFRCLLAVAGVPCRTVPRAVRLDRYGFVVDVSAPDVDPNLVRLSFARPVRCRHDLARLLHPVLFPHSATKSH